MQISHSHSVPNVSPLPLSSEMANTHSPSTASNPFYVTLYPMDIKTYLLRVEERKDCPYSGFNMPRRGGKLRMPNC